MRYRVFAYGTLMLPEIAASVTGECPQPEPARLPDHARHALRQRVFPGAVPRPGHAIDGVVYHDLTAAALERIDDFEGTLFHRRRVTVLTGGDGRESSAFVYLLRPRWRPLLLARDWSPRTFRRHWHPHYLRHCSEATRRQPPARSLAGPARG